MNNKKFEDYVCTLEQAKKLAELGFNEEPLLGYWIKNDTGKFDFNLTCIVKDTNLLKILERKEKYPAYTSQELSNHVDAQHINCDGFCFGEIFVGEFYSEFTSYKDNEVLARADYLINILEENKNAIMSQ